MYRKFLIFYLVATFLNSLFLGLGVYEIIHINGTMVSECEKFVGSYYLLVFSNLLFLIESLYRIFILQPCCKKENRKEMKYGVISIYTMFSIIVFYMWSIDVFLHTKNICPVLFKNNPNLYLFYILEIIQYSLLFGVFLFCIMCHCCCPHKCPLGCLSEDYINHILLN